MKASFWHRTRRRPSFWLGLFIACFLAWAWWDSYRMEMSAGFSATTRSYRVYRIEGATVFTFYVDWFASGSGFGFWYESANGREFWESRWDAFGVKHCRVPDPLVFSSVVGLWVGWLAFSDWRRKTRSNSSA